MPERQKLETIFLDNLALIERGVACVCRRHGLHGDDGAEFASWVKLEIVQDDYAVFEKFRGDSSLATYLAVVIAMLFREYRVQRWGRWRPSAAALRRGRIAVRLETLVHRDGYRLEEAAQLLQTSGETTLSARELAALLAELPARMPLRPVEVGPEPIADAAAIAGADELLLAGEADAQRRAADRALSRALGQLSPEDRLILRMRFWEAMSVADIARALGLAQKRLYRRIDRALVELREQLEAAGLSRDRARELLGGLAS